MLLYCLCYLHLLSSAHCYEFLFEIGPKRLNFLSGIGDQVVFHWPAEYGSYLLQFSGTVNQSGSGISVDCSNMNVSVIVRQNGIPLPNPLNASISDQTLFHTDGILHSGSFLVSRHSQGQLFNVSIDLERQNATDFFAALFLPSTLKRFDVAGLTRECRYYATLKVHAVNSGAVLDGNNFRKKRSKIQLKRKQSGLFDVTYLPENGKFNVTAGNKSDFYWEVFPIIDTGGTMDITIKTVFGFNFAVTDNVSIVSCLTNVLASDSQCAGNELRISNADASQQATWHIPFPLSGTWWLSIGLECNSTVCKDVVQVVHLQVSITTCIDGCNAGKNHGSCNIFSTDGILFSACVCKVGWIGLSCNDGRFAISFDTQLPHTLLLTLSNFMFIPCVILAIYRKFYTEALVYFFVTFMSSFYHACDQPGQAVYCILPFETLQFSDFLSSITAIWFTLIALAKLGPVVESFLHVLGLIVLAICVSYARFNVWTTVVPGAVGVVIVASTWGVKCHKIKVCYPGWKKFFFSIIPGGLCAAVGLSLYAFVETSNNYWIVHSIWHIMMACSVLFLLPIGPKHKNEKLYEIGDSAKSSPIFHIETRTGVSYRSESGSVSYL